MKHFAVSQANPAGSPSYYLPARLYDRSHLQYSDVPYGHLPWYKRKRTDSELVFNDTMILVSNEASHPYDIIRISPHIYVASKKFFSACIKLNVKMIDHRKIDVSTSNGKSLFKGEHHAIIFNETEILSVADEKSQFVKNKYDEPCRVKNLQIKPTLREHLFRLENMEGSSNTLICSDHFRSAVNDKLERINFFGIRDLEWPKIKPI
jgi:hypothetical protein